MFKEKAGKIQNREIARILGLPEKTVGGWKCKDKWNERLVGYSETAKRNTPKKVGAPKGSKNALGNKGGHGAPPGNVSTVKHGVYQTLYVDRLSDEEKELYLQTTAEVDIDQEIRLLRLKIARLVNHEETFFYDASGNKHSKKISEEDDRLVFLRLWINLES